MLLKINKSYRGTLQTLNVVPFVDILFQLIVFFALVYKFAEMETFPVTVPDNCTFAQKQEQTQPGALVVTVMKNPQGRVEFAVGSQKVSASNCEALPGKLGQLLDLSLKDVPANARLVTLRVDKNVCFGQAQYALAGIAQSSAAEIKLAAFKGSRGGEE